MKFPESLRATAETAMLLPPSQSEHQLAKAVLYFLDKEAATAERTPLLKKLANIWIETGQLGTGLRTDEYVTAHKEAIMGIYEYCGKSLLEYLAYEDPQLPAERTPLWDAIQALVEQMECYNDGDLPYERGTDLCVPTNKCAKCDLRRLLADLQPPAEQGHREAIAQIDSLIEQYPGQPPAAAKDKSNAE